MKKKLRVTENEMRDIFTIMNYGEVQALKAILIKNNIINEKDFQKEMKDNGDKLNKIANKFRLGEEEQKPDYFG